MQRVPVDAQIVSADDYVMTSEKQAHINKANEHLRKGDQAKALEELRLGDVEVSFSRTWIPIAQSERQVDQAIKLADAGKYYEANLALKAIEDSATVDTATVVNLPKTNGVAKTAAK